MRLGCCAAVLIVFSSVGIAENTIKTTLPEGVAKLPIQAPEIVALAWQLEGGIGPLWHSDGSLLNDEESANLLLDVERPAIHKPQRGYEDKVSRTLIVVFDVGDDLPAGYSNVKVQGEFLSDRVRSFGTWRNSRQGKVHQDRLYAVSAVTISFESKHKLEWPDKVSLTGKYPIEQPVVIHKFDKWPDTVVDIADDVTWKANQINVNYRGVLRSLRHETDALISYFTRLYCNGERVRNDYSTFEDGGVDGPLYELNVSVPFDRKEFERLECYRLRYAVSVFEEVVIRNDLAE